MIAKANILRLFLFLIFIAIYVYVLRLISKIVYPIGNW
jgi:hypothetical protein